MTTIFFFFLCFVFSLFFFCFFFCMTTAFLFFLFQFDKFRPVLYPFNSSILRLSMGEKSVYVRVCVLRVRRT